LREKKKKKKSSLLAALTMQPVNPEYDHLFKITTVGDKGVGKSTLVRTYCGISIAKAEEERDVYIKKIRFVDRNTILRRKTTFFLCYLAHKKQKKGVLSRVPRDVILLILEHFAAPWVDDSEDANEGLVVKLQIWDIYRIERFRTSITGKSYRGAHCILLCCDLSNTESMQNVKLYMMEVDRYACENVLKIVVGLKSDLEKDEEAAKILIGWCEEWKVDYLEVCALKGIGVDQVFIRAIELIETSLENQYNRQHRQLVIEYKPNKKCVIV
jgi:GTPase SAR1 family protein